MHRVAFKMKLFDNTVDEYKKRHNALWPELKALLKNTGISGYSIFHDADTNSLFAVFQASDEKLLQGLSVNPVMQKWWDHLVDIMETNPDHSPVQFPLSEIFYME